MEYGNDGISQKGDRAAVGVSGLLERASLHARGVLESIQALAGTKACKAVQINELKKFALSNACWIEDISTKLFDATDNTTLFCCLQTIWLASLKIKMARYVRF